MRGQVSGPPTRRERGMTLVEMMIVVVIIGILMGLAFVLLRGRPGLEETAHQISNQLREASRKAISGGIVDQTLDDDPLGDPPPGARTRLHIEFDSASQRQVVTVEVLDETLNPDQWFIHSELYLREGVEIYGYSDQLVVTAADIGDAYGSGSGAGSLTPTTLVSASNGSGTDASAEIYFNPDGSVAVGGGNPLTLFLLDTGAQAKRMRITVLPLQGQPLVFGGW